MGLGFAQDSDFDGFPDFVEIQSAQEREAFLDWFAAVAEAQDLAISPLWDEDYQDCSGLLRFAFQQALEPKDASWYQQFVELNIRTAASYDLSYPWPVLSRSLFRVASGSYQSNDVKVGRLVGLTSSEYLMRHNTVYLGHDWREASRGDLLFFAHPLAEGTGYHSMIYLGGGEVVYHTGLRVEDEGEVKRVSLLELFQHPDASWHPRANNPHFLGFFRWKIVS